MAKRIVESYDFGRELTKQEKKAIIQAILDNASLGKKSYKQLSTLMENFQRIGLEEKEIYGAIINLGVNGTILEEAGYAYTNLLDNTNNVWEEISQHKDQIETRVNEITILTAVSNNMSEQEEQELMKQLEELGISKSFTKPKNSRNVCMAKKIVESYEFGRELTKEEKKVIIQEILNNVGLDNISSAYLSTLMKRLQQVGFKEQEIFGMIINLGINGKILDKPGFSYTNMLGNINNVCQTITQYKGQIETSVNPITILTAQSASIDEEELKDQLEQLGINREFIEQKDIKNVYMAKKTVECYDFGRQLSQKEQCAIIQSILNNTKLDKQGRRYLSSLMQTLYNIGLNEQAIYGTIINLGVNKSVLEEKGYSYSNLLMNTNNSCQTIANHLSEMQTGVTEETIQKALNKAVKLMKKSVKSQKDKGRIEMQTDTRSKLNRLAAIQIQLPLEEVVPVQN